MATEEMRDLASYFNYELATFVALLAVSLIGVATVLLGPTLKSFRERFQILSSDEKRDTLLFALEQAASWILVFVITTTVGSQWPNYFGEAMMGSLFLAFVILPLAFIVARRLRRKRGQEQVRMKIDTMAVVLLGGYMFLVFGILAQLLALTGIGGIALAIHGGPFEEENFRYGILSLFWGMFFFVVGILAFVLVNAWAGIGQFLGLLKKERQD
jgi:hypothetical protein